MAEWRLYDTPCPIDEEPVSWVKCGDCKYFRGGVSYPDKRDPETKEIIGPGDKKINCNWPRNGSEIWRYPLPSYLTEAEWDD